MARFGGHTLLNLNQTAITNLEPIAAMRQLQTLSIDGTAIGDVSVVMGWTNLIELSLARSAVTNLPISGLASLERLWLDRLHLTNLSFVSSLYRLTYLQAPDNAISDLMPLVGLTNLDTVVLRGNAITNPAPLLGLPALRLLDLGGNSINMTSGEPGRQAAEQLAQQIPYAGFGWQRFQPILRFSLQPAGPDDTRVILRFDGSEGINYAVYSSTNLVDWTYAATASGLRFATTTATLPRPSADRTFYRLQFW